MDARVARPREDEEAGHVGDGADHHRPQTGFGHRSVVVGAEACKVVALVVQGEEAGEEAADEDGDEGQGGHDGGPVSDGLELDGEGSEVAGERG